MKVKDDFKVGDYVHCDWGERGYYAGVITNTYADSDYRDIVAVRGLSSGKEEVFHVSFLRKCDDIEAAKAALTS